MWVRLSVPCNVTRVKEIVVRTDRLQNESQQMFALCDQGKKEDRGEMIGQNPKAEVAPSSVSGNRDKERVLKRDVVVNRWGESRAKLRAKHHNRDLRDCSLSDKIYWNYRQNHRGKKRKESWTRRTYAFKPELYIYIYKSPPARKRENTLRRNPSKR